MSLTDFENNRCFLCGEYGADSKDHIPPKGIFLPKTKNIGEQLITVPAHISCNQNSSKDDEYFRLCLNISGYWNSENARELWNTKIYKSLSRPKAKWFRKDIVESLQPVDLKTPSGIFLQKTMQLTIDRNRIDNMIIKIVRGLFYFETQNILPIQNKIDVLLIQNTEDNILSLASLMTPTKIYGKETFKYRWAKFSDEKNSSMFLMSFYRSIFFLGVTYDKYSKLNNLTLTAPDVRSE